MSQVLVHRIVQVSHVGYSRNMLASPGFGRPRHRRCWCIVSYDVYKRGEGTRNLNYLKQ